MPTIEDVVRTAKVLAFAIGKGGVGKTFSSVQIAYELAQLGYQVLLVDLDPQANATENLGFDPKTVKGTVYDILAYDDDTPFSEIILESEYGVHVASGHTAMVALERTAERGFEFKLAEKLKPLHSRYDYIFLDCPPALGNLTFAALVAASGVLAPVKPGEFEAKAFYTLQKEIATVKSKYNDEIRLEYVLITDFDKRLKVSTKIRDEIKEAWPDQFLGEIPRAVKASESQFAHVPLALYEPNSKAVSAYRDVAKIIHERSAAR